MSPDCEACEFFDGSCCGCPRRSRVDDGHLIFVCDPRCENIDSWCGDEREPQ